MGRGVKKKKNTRALVLYLPFDERLRNNTNI